MTREKRIERAQLKVLFNCPFFASGVARLPVRFTDRQWNGSPLQTASTNGKEIIWNPEWFDQMADEHVVTVYCEEVAHCLLGHLWRMPSGGDQETWGKAADACARNMMADFSAFKTGQGAADPFPFPYNMDKFHTGYKDMAEEQVYQKLMLGPKQPKNGPGNGPGQGKGGKSPSGGGNGQKPPQSNPGGGGPPPFAEFEPQSTSGNSQSAKESKEQAQDWQNAFISAVHAAKQRGEAPAGIQRMIDGLLSPEVPWQEILRNCLRELCNDDWNWMKRNIPLGDSTGFILPSLESEKVGGVTFCVDTSGSIDHELLKAFKSEMQGCLDTLKPSSLIEISCDSAIHRIKEYRLGESVDMEAPGGGGTSFKPPILHCNEMQQIPKCMVYLTDLQGDFPEQEPPYPVIWIAYNTDQKAPFGTTIRVK